MARSLWRRPKHFSPQSHVFLSATSQTRRWLRGVCFVPCSQTYKIHLRPLCAVWWVLVACSMCEDRYCVEFKSARLERILVCVCGAVKFCVDSWVGFTTKKIVAMQWWWCTCGTFKVENVVQFLKSISIKLNLEPVSCIVYMYIFIKPAVQFNFKRWKRICLHPSNAAAGHTHTHDRHETHT